MSKSLQEQLLASGVAKPKQAKKAKREKVKRDQAARREGKTPAEKQALADEVARAEAAKRERDRQLNASQKARREAHERDQSVGQIIERNRVKAGAKGEDGVAYSYTIGAKIRRIEVSDAQRRDLADGRLAVVRHREVASLVPRAVAERLQTMIPDQIWLMSKATDEAVDPDDPYAAYQVPDDLMW
ncbi:DUF2058 domain-containing protein [Salinisphaera aquimarina]|uniref:DUF2058 domain-containing protein n=1 Tax=Salinisphaera aquimarina TaxID=2094031 RepID=A0ABV7EMF4_9GAMM